MTRAGSWKSVGWVQSQPQQTCSTKQRQRQGWAGQDLTSRGGSVACRMPRSKPFEGLAGRRSLALPWQDGWIHSREGSEWEGRARQGREDRDPARIALRSSIETNQSAPRALEGKTRTGWEPRVDSFSFGACLHACGLAGLTLKRAFPSLSSACSGAAAAAAAAPPCMDGVGGRAMPGHVTLSPKISTGWRLRGGMLKIGILCLGKAGHGPPALHVCSR